MRTIGIEEGRSAELFVVPYRHKYTSEPYLPIWMATEPISFGALSKMLRNVDNTPLQKKIAWEFGQPEVLFSSWTHVLSTVRNTCAHHSRLWNRELVVKPLFPKSWRVAGISNRRFYAVVLVIQTMLEKVSPNSRWKERLKAHFNAHPSVDIAHMHFPPDWQNRRPWV
jgi:abortive infection bacteriophage resistance protein